MNDPKLFEDLSTKKESEYEYKGPKLKDIFEDPDMKFALEYTPDINEVIKNHLKRPGCF